MFIPEMGQMIFGTAWGQFECPDFIERGIATLNDKLEAQFGDGFYVGNNGVIYHNDTFVIQAYYWGACMCGYDGLERQWEKDNKHSSDCFHEAYEAFLDHYGSEWSRLAEEIGEEKWREAYENFKSQHGLHQGDEGDHGIAVKCDCGNDSRWREWRSTHAHSENCPIVRPNFWHVASDTRIHWYKYPNRGMSINKKISIEFWMKLVEECLESIGNDKRDREFFEGV